MVPGKADAVWNELLREAGQVEAERAANVTVAEAERELANAGFDVDTERRASEARVRPRVDRRPPKSAAKPTPVAVPGLRPRRELWLVAASFAALCVGAVVAALESNPTNPVADNGESPRPASSALATAAALRDEADRACRQQLWGACAQRLDAAKAIDPDGEGEERVRQWRSAIAEQQGRRFDSKPRVEQRP
jgi:hypothetical protein